jgi:hypothetical protein
MQVLVYGIVNLHLKIGNKDMDERDYKAMNKDLSNLPEVDPSKVMKLQEGTDQVKSKKIKLDNYHYHEMLDRLHVVMSMIDDHLQQHPVAKIETDIKDLISEAQDKLHEAYQVTGNKY